MKEASKSVLNITHSQVKIAEAVATEIVKRFTTTTTVKRFNHLLHRVASDTLTDWFAGKFIAGGPTDPPRGAPVQTKKAGGAS